MSSDVARSCAPSSTSLMPAAATTSLRAATRPATASSSVPRVRSLAPSTTAARPAAAASAAAATTSRPSATRSAPSIASTSDTRAARSAVCCDPRLRGALGRGLGGRLGGRRLGRGLGRGLGRLRRRRVAPSARQPLSGRRRRCGALRRSPWWRPSRPSSWSSPGACRSSLSWLPWTVLPDRHRTPIDFVWNRQASTGRVRGGATGVRGGGPDSYDAATQAPPRRWPSERPRREGSRMTTAAAKAKPKQSALPIFGGILPIDPGPRPDRRHRRRDPRSAGHPGGHGLHEDRGHARRHRPLHAPPAGPPVRHLRVVAAPRGRRRLGDGRDPRDRPRRDRRRGRLARSTSRWPGSPRSCAARSCSLARILRLGFIANFLSRSVLIGFLTGVGIQVAMGQVAGMFGVSATAAARPSRSSPTRSGRSRPATRVYATLAVSIAVLGTIVGLGIVNKKIPGALIAVVGAIGLSYLPRPGRPGA